MWDTIFEIVKENADNQCPSKNMTFRQDSPEWITKEILSEINLKDYLYKNAKKTNSPDDWDVFKNKKNNVKRLLASAKENFVKNKLADLKGNSRKCWRDIDKNKWSREK